MAKKKGKTPMEKLTQNHEKFMKDKDVNPKGKELFNKRAVHLLFH